MFIEIPFADDNLEIEMSRYLYQSEMQASIIKFFEQFDLELAQQIAADFKASNEEFQWEIRTAYNRVECLVNHKESRYTMHLTDANKDLMKEIKPLQISGEQFKFFEKLAEPGNIYFQNIHDEYILLKSKWSRYHEVEQHWRGFLAKLRTALNNWDSSFNQMGFYENKIIKFQDFKSSESNL